MQGMMEEIRGICELCISSEMSWKACYGIKVRFRNTNEKYHTYTEKW